MDIIMPLLAKLWEKQLSVLLARPVYLNVLFLKLTLMQHPCSERAALT